MNFISVETPISEKKEYWPLSHCTKQISRFRCYLIISPDEFVFVSQSLELLPSVCVQCVRKKRQRNGSDELAFAGLCSSPVSL